ncbi:hypothetical protein L1887_53704 [Cichorium endivia]|nr:hypothetical protein L1887_53704 [Cichorium endivia]
MLANRRRRRNLLNATETRVAPRTHARTHASEAGSFQTPTLGFIFAQDGLQATMKAGTRGLGGRVNTKTGTLPLCHESGWISTLGLAASPLPSGLARLSPWTRVEPRRALCDCRVGCQLSVGCSTARVPRSKQSILPPPRRRSDTAPAPSPLLCLHSAPIHASAFPPPPNRPHFSLVSSADAPPIEDGTMGPGFRLA